MPPLGTSATAIEDTSCPEPHATKIAVVVFELATMVTFVKLALVMPSHMTEPWLRELASVTTVTGKPVTVRFPEAVECVNADVLI